MKETEAFMTEEEFDSLMDDIFKRTDNLDDIQFEPKIKTRIIIGDTVMPQDRIKSYSFDGEKLTICFKFNPYTDTFSVYPYFDVEDDNLEIHWRDKPNTKAAWEV